MTIPVTSPLIKRFQSGTIGIAHAADIDLPDGSNVQTELQSLSTRISNIPTQNGGASAFTNVEITELKGFASIYRDAVPVQEISYDTSRYNRPWEWRTTSDKYAATGITFDEDTANEVEVQGQSAHQNRVISLEWQGDNPAADTDVYWDDDDIVLATYKMDGTWALNRHVPARTSNTAYTNHTRLATGNVPPLNLNDDTEIRGNDQGLSIIIIEPAAGDVVSSRHWNMQVSLVEPNTTPIIVTATGFDVNDSRWSGLSNGQSTAWIDWHYWNSGGIQVWIQARYRRVSASQRVVDFQLADPSSAPPRAPLTATQAFHSQDTFMSIMATRQYEDVTIATTVPAVNQEVPVRGGDTDAAVVGKNILMQIEQIGVTSQSWRVVPVVRQADGTVVQCDDVELGHFHDLTHTTFDSANVRAAGIEQVGVHQGLRHSELAERLTSHFNEKWVHGLAYLRTVRTNHEILEQIVFAERPTYNNSSFATLSDVQAGVSGNTQSYIIAESNELATRSDAGYVEVDQQERTAEDRDIPAQAGDPQRGGFKLFRYDRSAQYRARILAHMTDSQLEVIGEIILDGRFFTRSEYERAVGNVPFNNAVGVQVVLPDGTRGTITPGYTTDNIPLFALSDEVRTWAAGTTRQILANIYLEATAERHSNAEVIRLIDQEVPEARRVPVAVNPDGTRYLDDEGNYTVPAGTGGGGGGTFGDGYMEREETTADVDISSSQTGQFVDTGLNVGDWGNDAIEIAIYEGAIGGTVNVRGFGILTTTASRFRALTAVTAGTTWSNISQSQRAWFVIRSSSEDTTSQTTLLRVFFIGRLANNNIAIVAFNQFDDPQPMVLTRFIVRGAVQDGGGTSLPTATEGQIWRADDKGAPQAADFPTYIESVDSNISADGQTHTLDLSLAANRGVNTLRLTGDFATRTTLNITALPQDSIFYALNQNRGVGDFLINAGNSTNAIVPANENAILRITSRTSGGGGQIEVWGLFSETPQQYTIRTTAPQAADGRDGDFSEVVVNGTKTGYQKVSGVWVPRGSYSVGGGATEDFDDYNPYTAITTITLPTPDSYNAIVMNTAAVSPAVVTIPSSAYGRRFIVSNPNVTHNMSIDTAADTAVVFAPGESGIVAVSSTGLMERINMLPASILTRLTAVEARPAPVKWAPLNTDNVNQSGAREITTLASLEFDSARIRGSCPSYKISGTMNDLTDEQKSNFPGHRAFLIIHDGTNSAFNFITDFRGAEQMNPVPVGYRRMFWVNPVGNAQIIGDYNSNPDGN